VTFSELAPVDGPPTRSFTFYVIISTSIMCDTGNIEKCGGDCVNEKITKNYLKF